MDFKVGIGCFAHVWDKGTEIHWHIADPAAQQRTGYTAIGGYIPSHR